MKWSLRLMVIFAVIALLCQAGIILIDATAGTPCSDEQVLRSGAVKAYYQLLDGEPGEAQTTLRRTLEAAGEEL